MVFFALMCAHKPLKLAKLKSKKVAKSHATSLITVLSGLGGYLDLSITPGPLNKTDHNASDTIPAFLFIYMEIKNENMSLCSSKRPLHTLVNITLVIESIRLWRRYSST